MIVLKSIFTNNSGKTLTISIYDRDATESTDIEFDCDPDFLKYRWEGAANDPYKRIIPAAVEFVVLTGCSDYTEEQNDAIAAFYDGVSNSYEGRYYISVSGGGFSFRGKILPDVGDFLLEEIGDFVITAIDGITDLKDIEYRPEDYSDLVAADAIKTDTFATHTRNILNKIDTVQYFMELLHANSIAFPLYSTSNNWTETNSIAGDIWRQVKVRNYWYEQKSETYRKYQSCWDVLTDMLTGFNARMIYDNGVYHIEQLGYMDNNPVDIVTRQYLILPNGDEVLGSALTKVQHNFDANDNLQASRGITQTRLAGLKAVVLEQSKAFFNYINGMVLGSTNAGPHYFGWIISTGDKLVSQLFLHITGTPWTDITYQSTMTIVHTLNVEISVGDYWLVASDPSYANVLNLNIDGQYFVAQGGTIPELSWSLIPNTITINISKTFVNQGLSNYNSWIDAIKTTSLVIQSAEIPAEGILRIKINSFVSKRNGTVISSFPTVGVSFGAKSRIILGNGYNDLYEQPTQIKRYEVGDVRNSQVYTVKCGYYDSNETKVMQGQLFMTIVGNPNYAEYPTSLWTDPDDETPLPIQDLMLRQMLAMRAKPTNTIKISLYYRNNTMINMRDQIVFKGEVYIPINMEMIANGPGGYTTWNTTMWKVTKDYDGINVVPIPEPEIEPTGYPVPDGSLDLYNVGGVQTGLEYWEEWYNVTTPYVSSLDGEDYTLVNISDDYTTYIKKKWHLYINGVKWLYTPGTGTLLNRQWRFDQDNNRIVFFKASGPVGHIEVLKYY